MAVVRYLVKDVEASVAFYESLGFQVIERMGPPFAMVGRGDLTLWLSGPASSAARRMPDGATPAPGGWNRLVIEVDDIGASIQSLRARGVKFRNEIVEGPGGRQVVLDDPSGNPIELFQPAGR